MTTWNYKNIKRYIESQDWYQKIEISNGLVTPGKTDSSKRLKFLDGENLSGKSVLDIGCNSGFYCLWAKKTGAERVVGIDIDKMRIEQAKTLAEIEGLSIEYYEKNLEEIEEIGRFDIAFCFAVLTEIHDILCAFEALKKVIGQKAYVEMALAKPIIYFSKSLYWLKGLLSKIYSTGILEIRPTKKNWMISPSLRAIKDILGDEFRIVKRGKGLKYNMISIERIQIT